MPSNQSLSPMNDSALSTDADYQGLLSRISEVYTNGQLRAHQAVNSQLTATYWQIGHDIVEFEQGGKVRAVYGKALLENLSRDLGVRHGKGFSRSNVARFRQFYQLYPNCAALPHKLSWTLIVELLKIDDPLERGFYEQQTLRREELRRGLELHLTNCRTARPNIGKRCGGGQMKSAYKLNLHGIGYGN